MQTSSTHSVMNIGLVEGPTPSALLQNLRPRRHHILPCFQKLRPGLCRLRFLHFLRLRCGVPGRLLHGPIVKEECDLTFAWGEYSNSTRCLREVILPSRLVATSLFQLFGVGALAHRGLPPFIGGLCGDHSPHRTTMTQTECCPIFKFGSWWCAFQMAPPGAIAHSRALLCPRAPFFSFSSFVSPLRPLGLGFLGRCDPRSLIVLRRYGRRPGQPSSSSLARRACVHVLPFSAPGIAVYGYKYSWSSSTGTP